MPPENNKFKQLSGVGFNNNNQLRGLNSFTKNLEKHFFTSVSICHSTKNLSKVIIVLEMHFNFDVSDMLHHYESGTWGCLNSQNQNFLEFVNQLKDVNNCFIEIDELTLHFKNTSIIINQIYENSIAEQFDSILQKLNENFISFTKGISRVPYEIFIPVVEEEIHVSSSVDNRPNSSCLDFGHEDDFKFWALYYDGERKAVIYDTKSSMFTLGNLYYLNNE